MEESKDLIADAIEPFLGIINIEDNVDVSEIVLTKNNAASILNPNSNDNRRLFQVKRFGMKWDCSVDIKEQPDLLELYGPKDLL